MIASRLRSRFRPFSDISIVIRGRSLAGPRSVWTDPPSRDEAPSFYDITVEEYAKRPITTLTLDRMLEAGRDAWFDPTKVLRNARFTWEELPKRLARRLLDLQLLPYIVVTNPHIGRVYRAYHHAFNVIKDTPPPSDMTENEQFSMLLRRLVDEHAPLLDSLANGLKELRRKPLVGRHLQLDTFLEAMLRSRISRRVLAEQHININNGRPGYIGVICTDLSLADSVDFAASRCRQVCMETFGMAPEVLVSGDTSLKVPYIPAHLDYMLYELLKNAARAVVEHHRGKEGFLRSASPRGTFGPYRLPTVHVRICGGANDVTLRISDQGGGIDPDHIDRVWEFGWTDLDPGNMPGSLEDGLPREGLGLDSPLHIQEWQGSIAANHAGGRYRMAGLGFGLPLSRLYARYFGGDLRLVSMPGYGVDAFLYIKGLSSEKGQEWREEGDDEPGSMDEIVGALSAAALVDSGAA